LDYDFITNEQSINIVLENPLDENDYPIYYEPANVGIARMFGGTQGLRHHLAVINKIARVTFMPKSGNMDKIRGIYWNVISHIMNGNRINIIALIMDQLADLRPGSSSLSRGLTPSVLPSLGSRITSICVELYLC